MSKEDEKSKAFIREVIEDVLCKDFGFCSVKDKPHEQENLKKELKNEPAPIIKLKDFNGTIQYNKEKGSYDVITQKKSPVGVSCPPDKKPSSNGKSFGCE